eukprot:CAMPEP_0170518370 /NCGR_PEP_ID=MMETSP0209-20121228/4069_1 /TAXON_ID=665100 ORGANISM="Litonotus pictus, Strain P1" /NCGR_SAMPLE_ID=MMETSP0209 /ASSEMBLY_ACC=CAM_ASM_000301 /LENGTH=615 /DNA_ID=CAMNT_0010803899 /DNA_START=153 /DNA_END=2000 /DNA_ORIENTATION=+
MNYINPHASFAKSLGFDSEVFFTLILPPIIFGAGYNLRRKFFFKYLFYILLFGVVGTVINFCLVAPLTLLVNDNYGFALTTKQDIFDEEGKVRPDVLEHEEEEKKQEKKNKRLLEEIEQMNQGESENKNETEAEVVSDNETKEVEEGKEISSEVEGETQKESQSESSEVSEGEESKENHGKKEEASGELGVLRFTVNEILLFASVISATDAVAALAFVKEESDPKLFPILFGEGVVNDAVCIVLYQIIKGFLESGDPFTVKTPFKMANKFLGLFFISLLIAIIIGGGSALFFKKLKVLKINRVQELCLLIFFAFFSYSGTELLGKSPIVAILFSGIFMSQYCFYNLSFQAREESSVVTKMLSTIAEGFVFVYMGLTVFYYFTRAFSLAFVIWEFFILLASRTTMVFGSCFILETLGVKSFRMKFSDKGIMAYSGTIRGAIAFGLACSLELENELHRTVLISGTLCLVLTTTVILGALMPFWVAFMKSFDSEEDREMALKGAIIPTSLENEFGYDFSHPNFTQETLVSKEKDENEIKKRLSYYVASNWIEYDNKTVKPFLLYDYPNCIEDHEILSKRLLEATAEISNEKTRKNKELITENEKQELRDVKIFQPNDA